MQNIEDLPSIEKNIASRKIGSFKGSNGPTILILGGLHGNEPAGIEAFKRVIDKLNHKNLKFSGQLHGFIGNLTALKNNERFVHEDMNRYWYDFMDRRIENSLPHEISEDNDREELMDVIIESIKNSDEPIVFFDLHSTSAPSLPFASINDSLYNRSLIKDIPVPIILGLQEQIEGTLNGLLNDLGLPAILFEAGQHDDPETVDLHEAFIWYMLCRLGCIKRNTVKSLNKYKDVLKSASKGMEGFYEVTFRHGIVPEDKFKMKEGHSSFKRVKENQIIATDKHGDIKSPQSNLMFMPLYQSKGSDGFFLIKPVKSIWMTFSKWLRKRRLDKYIHHLPGVEIYHNEEDTFEVNKSVASILALQIFHLLGYRKETVVGDKLYVSRIRYDDKPPPKSTFFNNLKDFHHFEI